MGTASYFTFMTSLCCLGVFVTAFLLRFFLWCRQVSLLVSSLLSMVRSSSGVVTSCSVRVAVSSSFLWFVTSSCLLVVVVSWSSFCFVISSSCLRVDSLFFVQHLDLLLPCRRSPSSSSHSFSSSWWSSASSCHPSSIFFMFFLAFFFSFLFFFFIVGVLERTSIFIFFFILFFGVASISSLSFWYRRYSFILLVVATLSIVHLFSGQRPARDSNPGLTLNGWCLRPMSYSELRSAEFERNHILIYSCSWGHLAIWRIVVRIHLAPVRCLISKCCDPPFISQWEGRWGRRFESMSRQSNFVAKISKCQTFNFFRKSDFPRFRTHNLWLSSQLI